MKKVEKLSKREFRNSSQNRKTVKIERDSLSHTDYNINGLPTLFSTTKKRNKIWKKVVIAVGCDPGILFGVFCPLHRPRSGIVRRTTDNRRT